MQEYDFIPAIGKGVDEFWAETNGLARGNDADMVLAYMYRMLQTARAEGLSLRERSFRSFGERVKMFEGVKEWFARVNEYGRERGLEVEHYIISSGLREMIEGTEIAREFRQIYASSFLYDVDGIAVWPALAVNYTNKTQFLYKINKGIESAYDTESINKFVPAKERAIPFERMAYFGDGMTDVPCMKLVHDQGGHSIAVYDPELASGPETSEQLARDGRVSYVCPADYREGGAIDMLIRAIMDKIAADIALADLSARV